ncbi:hypothetical protein ACI0FR_03260 [Paenochrobactrum sp. BZR 201-1]
MSVKNTSPAVYDDVHLALSFYKVPMIVERQVCAPIPVVHHERHCLHTKLNGLAAFHLLDIRFINRDMRSHVGVLGVIGVVNLPVLKCFSLDVATMDLMWWTAS